MSRAAEGSPKPTGKVYVPAAAGLLVKMSEPPLSTSIGGDSGSAIAAHTWLGVQVTERTTWASEGIETGCQLSPPFTVSARCA